MEDWRFGRVPLANAIRLAISIQKERLWERLPETRVGRCSRKKAKVFLLRLQTIATNRSVSVLLNRSDRIKGAVNLTIVKLINSKRKTIYIYIFKSSLCFHLFVLLLICSIVIIIFHLIINLFIRINNLFL